MDKILKSKGAAWGALILVIFILIATFSFRRAFDWWAFIDIFFAFMAAFAHAMSVTISKINQYVGRKLDLIALVLFALAVVAFIVEFILFQNGF